jgi:hypothetical protein
MSNPEVIIVHDGLISGHRRDKPRSPPRRHIPQ